MKPSSKLNSTIAIYDLLWTRVTRPDAHGKGDFVILLKIISSRFYFFRESISSSQRVLTISLDTLSNHLLVFTSRSILSIEIFTGDISMLWSLHLFYEFNSFIIISFLLYYNILVSLVVIPTFYALVIALDTQIVCFCLWVLVKFW